MTQPEYTLDLLTGPAPLCVSGEFLDAFSALLARAAALPRPDGAAPLSACTEDSGLVGDVWTVLAKCFPDGQVVAGTLYPSLAQELHRYRPTPWSPMAGPWWWGNPSPVPSLFGPDGRGTTAAALEIHSAALRLWASLPVFTARAEALATLFTLSDNALLSGTSEEVVKIWASHADTTVLAAFPELYGPAGLVSVRAGEALATTSALLGEPDSAPQVVAADLAQELSIRSIPPTPALLAALRDLGPRLEAAMGDALTVLHPSVETAILAELSRPALRREYLAARSRLAYAAARLAGATSVAARNGTYDAMDGLVAAFTAWPQPPSIPVLVDSPPASAVAPGTPLEGALPPHGLLGQPELVQALDRVKATLQALGPGRVNLDPPHLLLAGPDSTGRRLGATALAHLLAEHGVGDGSVTDISVDALTDVTEHRVAIAVVTAIRDAKPGVLTLSPLDRLLTTNSPAVEAVLRALLARLSAPGAPTLVLIGDPLSPVALAASARELYQLLQVVRTYDLDDTSVYSLTLHHFSQRNLRVPPEAEPALEQALADLRPTTVRNAARAALVVREATRNAASRLARLGAPPGSLTSLASPDFVGIHPPIPPGEARAMARLHSLTGLEQVKGLVAEMVAEAEVGVRRRGLGLNTLLPSRHMVFAGNPGTAKTTVARLIGAAYREVGLLPVGHVVEVDRSDLVGRYIGHTGPRVAAAFSRARGGVLFIDEAYSLSAAGTSGGGDFGEEAISTMVKCMEDLRDQVVVIAAGYPEPMAEFLDTNPGLASRFGRTVTFPDYTLDELTSIFSSLAREAGLHFDLAVLGRVASLLAPLRSARDFGNGRTVRNLLETTLAAQALRLQRTPSGVASLTVDDLQTLLSEDVALPTGLRRSQGIGFTAGL